MSLIERAVNRLAGNANGEAPTPAQPAEEASAQAQPKPSTIEKFAERIAQSQADDAASLGASPTSVAAQPVQPVQPVHPVQPAQPVPHVPPPRSAPAAEHSQTVHVQFEPLRARGFVVPGGEQSHIAQEFRVIKRPLLANAFGKGATPVRNGKRVMVTSALPGEGKSFCAINLALSIAAERDHKVLLVDADVARPSIPRELGFRAAGGLMDCLIDNSLDVAAFTLETDVENLAVLPAGRRHEQATEFLASAAMSRVLEQLSARFPDRIMIFDSPPLLVTTESRVLATYMGQIVMVVESGRTPRSAVTDALATIEGATEVVGMLLNKSTGSGVGGYGGQNYGYGYGYGYGHRAGE